MRKATIVGRHAENGRRIYDGRRAKQLTQTQLGEAAGVTYRQIIRLENGENLPSGPVRDKIAEILEVDRLSIQSGDDDLEEAALGGPFRNGSGRGAAGAGGGQAARPNGEVAA